MRNAAGHGDIDHRREKRGAQRGSGIEAAEPYRVSHLAVGPHDDDARDLLRALDGTHLLDGEPNRVRRSPPLGILGQSPQRLLNGRDRSDDQNAQCGNRFGPTWGDPCAHSSRFGLTK
jgi:hypothetical protein